MAFRFYNILRINIKDARERILSELPMIQDAYIIRKMPGSLSINISERTPIAWLSGPEILENNFVNILGHAGPDVTNDKKFYWRTLFRII